VYRRVRDPVQLGELWRLVSPERGSGDLAALAYAAADRSRAVVFAYRLPGAAPASREVVVPLAGLDPTRTYEVRAVDLELDEPLPSTTMTGADLLRDGLEWQATAPVTAAIWELTPGT